MSTITTPAGQISRKVAVPAVVGTILTAAFAAEPQISAIFPQAIPFFAIAKVVAPVLLPAIGYQTKEWASVKGAIPPFIRQ